MLAVPTPTQHHRALATLEGSWRGPEHGPDGREALGAYDIEVALGGFALVLDYTQSVGGSPQYRMHGVIGWDTADEQYFFHWYDSLGGVGTDSYGKLDGGQLTLEGPDPAQGGRTRFSFDIAPDSFALTIAFSKDQESWTTAMQATYHRVQ